MFNLFGSNKVCGIDLGSKDIKIVEVEKYRNSFILNNYTIIEIESLKGLSYFLDTSQIFEETLAEILENGLKDFKTKRIVFSVPVGYYIYTNFSLPFIPLNSLENAIKFEYRKYIPVSQENFQIEWRNFKYSVSNISSQDKWFIFFTAIPESYILKIKNVCNLIRAKFLKVIPEVFTLEGFFNKNSDLIAIVDIGYTSSYITLIKEGKVIHSQKILISTKNIIDTFQNMMGMDHESSERIFKQKGFNILPEEYELKKAIDEIIKDLSYQILRVKNNWENFFGLKIETIYFTGSLTMATGFLNKISESLKEVEIKLFNPLEENIKVNSENIKNINKGPSLVQAIGSCIKFFLD